MKEYFAQKVEIDASTDYTFFIAFIVFRTTKYSMNLLIVLIHVFPKENVDRPFFFFLVDENYSVGQSKLWECKAVLVGP